MPTVVAHPPYGLEPKAECRLIAARTDAARHALAVRNEAIMVTLHDDPPESDADVRWMQTRSPARPDPREKFLSYFNAIEAFAYGSFAEGDPHGTACGHLDRRYDVFGYPVFRLFRGAGSAADLARGLERSGEGACP